MRRSRDDAKDGKTVKKYRLRETESGVDIVRRYLPNSCAEEGMFHLGICGYSPCHLFVERVVSNVEERLFEIIRSRQRDSFNLREYWSILDYYNSL